ncbi:branched-chain amino acid ABC transporter permease [Lacisediminihabitans profunda]|uniref:Branched-chain amino acid ABC transporter permease n=1 Tax=Lacisediminihabitans profunda TaxID=2594790 RepID=A0A5C8UNJ2_9MICO|nr:branched-chain amino acid ABC transporter permease [Lacisediminihabitans profunda]TXN29965.1 branched-chain amino acid ABC transporter permease [Lacisediminihabitans profunda]
MLQVLLSGLSIGAVYGLVAMAFAVVFYVTRVINFATGQLLMVAIMLTAGLSKAGLPDWLSISVGLTASTAAGVVIYFVAVRPVLRFDRFSFAWLVSTLGVAIVLQSAAAIIYGPTSQGFPKLLNRDNLVIGGASITLQELLAIIVAVVAVVGFEIFRRRTLFGKVGMAISSDPEMASAIGARVTAYAVAAFAIGGLLAGAAGVLIGPITYANPYLGDTYGITGFVALMIGGIERPAAAMGGGLVLGVLSVGANTFIGSQASDWFPFVVVVVVLLLAPHGLFASGDALKRLASGIGRRTATLKGAN